MTFAEVYEFARDSVLACLLAGSLCAYLGVYVLLRRVVFVSAAITQASGVGIAMAFFLASWVLSSPEGVKPVVPFWLSPQIWSLLAAVACAVAFSRNPGGGKLASETVVGLGWVIFGAALLLVMSSKRIVQEAREIDDLLYGSAILITPTHLKVLAAGVFALLLVHVLLFKEFVFLSYDPEMAQTLGYRVALWNGILFATLGVGISLAVRTLGALPTFGFLVIPGAAAQLLVRRIVWAFPLAIFFACASAAIGYYIAFVKELPVGPAMIGVASLFLLPGLAWRSFVR